MASPSSFGRNTTRMHVWTFLSPKYAAMMNSETCFNAASPSGRRCPTPSCGPGCVAHIWRLPSPSLQNGLPRPLCACATDVAGVRWQRISQCKEDALGVDQTYAEVRGFIASPASSDVACRMRHLAPNSRAFPRQVSWQRRRHGRALCKFRLSRRRARPSGSSCTSRAAAAQALC
jgi:hypothetical protein